MQWEDTNYKFISAFWLPWGAQFVKVHTLYYNVLTCRILSSNQLFNHELKFLRLWVMRILPVLSCFFTYYVTSIKVVPKACRCIRMAGEHNRICKSKREGWRETNPRKTFLDFLVSRNLQNKFLWIALDITLWYTLMEPWLHGTVMLVDLSSMYGCIRQSYIAF